MDNFYDVTTIIYEQLVGGYLLMTLWGLSVTRKLLGCPRHESGFMISDSLRPNSTTAHDSRQRTKQLKSRPRSTEIDLGKTREHTSYVCVCARRAWYRLVSRGVCHTSFFITKTGLSPSAAANAMECMETCFHNRKNRTLDFFAYTAVRFPHTRRDTKLRRYWDGLKTRGEKVC